MMFGRILVPLDGSQLSERSILHAVYLATLFKSEIILLTVMEATQPSEGIRLIDPLSWQIRKTEAELYLQNLARQLSDRDIQVGTVLLEGNSAEEIVNYAQNENIDLIVIATHGRGGLSRWNISSVVSKVLYKAFISVLIIRAYQSVPEEIGYRRILVPLDCSKRSECALPVAVAFAQAAGTNILLATIVKQPEVPFIQAPDAELSALSERFVEVSREVIRPYLNELKDRLQIEGDVIISDSDNVPGTLHEIADREDADLMILCAHGKTGGQDHPFGSVTNHCIQHGTRNVLIIQDVPHSLVRPTLAELSAQKYGSR